MLFVVRYDGCPAFDPHPQPLSLKAERGARRSLAHLGRGAQRGERVSVAQDSRPRSKSDIGRGVCGENAGGGQTPEDLTGVGQVIAAIHSLMWPTCQQQFSI